MFIYCSIVHCSVISKNSINVEVVLNFSKNSWICAGQISVIQKSWLLSDHSLSTVAVMSPVVSPEFATSPFSTTCVLGAKGTLLMGFGALSNGPLYCNVRVWNTGVANRSLCPDIKDYRFLNLADCQSASLSHMCRINTSFFSYSSPVRITGSASPTILYPLV